MNKNEKRTYEMKFAMQIPANMLKHYQQKYDYTTEKSLEHFHRIGPEQGYLTVDQLYEICQWKSNRRPRLAKTNSEEFVREITAFAFKAKCEESRIGALTLLAGVQFPTASVILHFCVDPSYPILDFRAIWSLGIEQPSFYTVEFWKEYVVICRGLAEKHKITVRELDMALWQYSREHQREIVA